MKRDMDLIRKIVLAVRDNDDVIRGIDGVDQDIYMEHARLLVEAGLIEANIQMSQRKPLVALIWRLTWTGQDFADAITDDTLWKKAKDNVIKPAASWTFGILLDYLKGQIARGLPSLPL